MLRSLGSEFDRYSSRFPATQDDRQIRVLIRSIEVFEGTSCLPTARLIVPLILAIFVSGCSFGPRNVATDRFNYTAAIERSNREQLLSNLVRLRYGEPPVFLSLGSILTQYVYSGRIGADGALTRDTTPAFTKWTLGGSASGTFIERPTLTYAPLVGQDFAQQLMAPIDSQAVFALAQSGWNPEELLKLTIERINDVDGRLSGLFSGPVDLERVRTFSQVVDMLLRAISRRAIEMHRDEIDPTKRYLVFAEDTDAETNALIAELKIALSLDVGRSRFRVTDRDIRSADEVTIRVRSFAAMLGLESRGIEVPAAHIDEQRAVSMTTPEQDPDVASLVRLRVRSQRERPADAFAAIRHHGYWFFIPNVDYQSKQTFGLLEYLYQIQAPEAQSVGGPVLTVPTG